MKPTLVGAVILAWKTSIECPGAAAEGEHAVKDVQRRKVHRKSRIKDQKDCEGSTKRKLDSRGISGKKIKYILNIRKFEGIMRTLDGMILMDSKWKAMGNRWTQVFEKYCAELGMP